MEKQYLTAVDPEIARVIDLELERQTSHLELIASENKIGRASCREKV